MDTELYNTAISSNTNVLMQNMDRLAVESTSNNNIVLHLVSQIGKSECVIEIVSMHPSLICWVNSNGDFAIHLAARNGYNSVVVARIGCAMSIDQELESGIGLAKEMLRMRNVHGDTALYDAVRFNYINTTKTLTREDPEFSHTSNNIGETPVCIAAERKYDDLVAVILKICTSPAYGGSRGRTALHGAILANSEGTRF